MRSSRTSRHRLTQRPIDVAARRGARPSPRLVSLTSHFRPLLGLPAWNVKRVYSTFLTLEFGEPHLRVREPIRTAKRRSRTVRELLARRTVHLRGDWHLWIYCCDWRVTRKGRRVGGSESRRSAERAACELQGQALRQVTFPRPGWTRFSFDLGGVLETRPYRDGRDLEQWLLYDPHGKALSLRGDGMCSYRDRTVRMGDETWHRPSSSAPRRR